ncbi:MAG: prepilin peptidase [Parvibaculales bacterium]
MFFDAQVTFASVVVFLIGLCFGSFLNVVALRYVLGEDWIKTPSACFSCGVKLSFSQNLPVWGWLGHGGKASCCGAKLPLRYLLVELFCGGLAVLSYVQLGLSMSLIFSLFFMLNVVIFLTDLEDFIIPDFASLGGAAAGLLMVCAGLDGLPTLREAVIGGVFGFGLLYAINAAYKLWRGHDGLGFGDVKLMAMYGVWLGPVAILPILFFSSLAGAILGIVLILLNKTPLMAAETQQAPVLPYGCFLVPAAILWVLFADSIALPIFLIAS